MDLETLTNHISKLGKDYFENACRIVLRDVFNFNAINVDGKNDGGTDFIAFNKEGERTNVAYQITTQKTEIKNKAYNDAKKSIEKLGVKKFYFMTIFILDETETRKIETLIEKELNISSTCLSARNIAALILSENLLVQFLDENNYPLPKNYKKSNYDFREIALHSYTLGSDDAKNMKGGIYDDTILYLLSEKEPLNRLDLVEAVIDFLNLSSTKEKDIQKRIDALFGKEKIRNNNNNEIILIGNSKDEILSRRKVYEIELSSMIAAQIDLLRNKYNIDWSDNDAKKISIWIAEAHINDQISSLKEVKASIVSNPLFKFENNGKGIEKIREYLSKKEKENEVLDRIIIDLLELASNHPLITKITRASIYLALEGRDPISAAKALGANRWSDFEILVEPSVAIPYLCSQLFSGNVNKYFDLSVKSIKRAIKIGANLNIPYFYINECAGHLLQARKYCSMDLNENELQFSNNAFVANYYALKLNNHRVPKNLMDYLSTFSSAIKTERDDIYKWVRAIMTDIQSLLAQAGIEFVNVPKYEDNYCKSFEEEYAYIINEFEIEKPTHLLKHDIYALQYTHDCIANENKHWIILTFDKTLIAVSKKNIYNGWITTPLKFINITETSKSLSETKYISLIHTVAITYAKTTSAGIVRNLKRQCKNLHCAELKHFTFNSCTCV
jgi:hypothetical protein